MKESDRTTKLRLYPRPVALADEEEIYGDLELQPAASQNLPYVLVNMVCSVDGRSSVGGRAAGIGSRADRGAMRALRSRVDAVMVGAGTLRAEKLNLGLDDPDAGQPLAVVVGGAGDLPLAEHLVPTQSQDVILALPQGPSAEGDAAHGCVTSRVTVLRCPGSEPNRVDLRRLLHTLKTKHAVHHLLVEGGPGLNRALIDARLADEIFLTVAPKLLLGREAAILSGAVGDEPSGEPRHLDLVSAHSADDELFLRYRLKHRP